MYNTTCGNDCKKTGPPIHLKVSNKEVGHCGIVSDQQGGEGSAQ